MKHSNVSIEDVQNYWNTRPCNIRHSQSKIGTIEYFNEVETRKYYVEPHIKNFAKFEDWKGKKVLEIGCGIGTDAVNFARAGAKYTGIELSNESLELAIQRFEIFNLQGKFCQGDVENLSAFLEIEKFDLIYSFGVLHHTPSLENALREIKKYCGFETKFKFMVYASNSWKQAMINAGLDQPEAQFGCPIANSYTKSQIKEILQESGFEIKKIYKDHIFPFDVDRYKKYEYIKVPWFDAMPPSVFRTLEENFGWHLLVESELA